VSEITSVCLRYTQGSSNKFYIILYLPNGQAVIGYGAMGAAGNWTSRGARDAQAKEREKLRDGYQRTVASNFSPDVWNTLLTHLRATYRQAAPVAGRPGVFRLEPGTSGGTPQAAPSAAPKRAAARDRINMWLGGGQG
jgi:hypothetical protein